MSYLSVLVCRVDDETHPDQLTELQRLDLPLPEVRQLQPETALDFLETQATTTAHAVARRLFVSQFEAVDAQLVADYQRLFPPRRRAR